MPVIDLNGTTAIMRGGTTIDALYRGAALVWSASPAGPLRTPVADTTAIGASVHSFGDAATGVTGAHGGILDDLRTGTIHQTFLPGSTETERYNENGPERTEAYTGPLLIALFGNIAAGQIWEPDSPEGIAQYAACLSYAQEAETMGRDSVVLYTPWPPSALLSPEIFEDASRKVEALRQYLQGEVSIPVWVIPSHLLMEYMVDLLGAGGVDGAYSGDGFHPNPGTPSSGLSWMVQQWLTMTQDTTPEADPNLTTIKAAAWDILTEYEWSGMGGTRVVIPTFNPATAQVYFDESDASGTVTSLTTRGSFAATLTQATATYAAAEMEADGLEIYGNVLRWNGSRGPFTRFRIVADLTLQNTPLAGSGSIFSVNPNGVTGVRFWLRYTSTNIQLVGPNGVTINLAPVVGLGERQVVAGELDIAAGTLTAIEADGETQQAAITGSAFSVTRIDVGQNSRIKIHALTMTAEA